uniref:Odorant receptor n=1 Tax=Lutzomyia longipalpis TaxID=7200 RepID=A0A240SXW3_LUTLO
MSIIETRENFENLAGKLKGFLKFSALVFSEKFFERYRKYLIIIPFILEVLTIVPYATKMITNDEGVIVFASMIPFAFGYFRAMLKILTILLHSEKIDGIFKWFHKLHLEHINDIFSQIYFENLQRIFKIVHFITRFVTISAGSALSICIFFMATDKLPFKVPFIDQSYQTFHHLIAEVAVTYNSFNTCLTDIIMIFTGVYFIGALDILSGIIGKLNESSNIAISGDILRQIIIFHLEIMNNFNDFCEIFEFLFIFELFHTIGFLLFDFYLIWQSDNLCFFLASASYIFVQFALFCLFGQIIFNRSERIFTDLYQTKWYEMEVKDQKAVLLIMKMSQNAFGLKAGRMYDINLILFFNVLKLCVSWYAILYTVLN